MSMRRNRKGVRKERIIMLTSSVLVLAALTVTGVFVRNNRKENEDNNVVDFSAIEGEASETAENVIAGDEIGTLFTEVGTDDLDYDPSFQEANSGNVENSDSNNSDSNNSDKNNSEADKDSKKSKDESAKASDSKSGSDSTDGQKSNDKTASKEDSKKSDSDKAESKKDSSGNNTENNEEGMIDENKEAAEDTEAIATTVQPILNFTEEDGLVWPIVGDILLNYSMDKTIYFPTLQQYKYHPAIVISATEGENIAAAADGRVISVAYDSQLGNTVVMDLGNQYELTYGQLDNITVSEGSYVAAGDIIGTVASPTKYYSLEGANVYFKLTKDGEPVNPLQKLN